MTEVVQQYICTLMNKLESTMSNLNLVVGDPPPQTQDLQQVTQQETIIQSTQPQMTQQLQETQIQQSQDAQTLNPQPQDTQAPVTQETQPQPTPATPTPKTSKHPPEEYPYSCPLCLEEFHSRKQLYRIVGCRHLYCQQCIIAYYTHSIQDSKLMVKCPHPQCTQELLFCNMKDLLDMSVILKFQRLSLKFPQNQNSKYIWCPGDNCKTKVFRQKAAKANEVMCPKCKLKICFKCGEWVHDGVQCGEADELTDKKIESERKYKEYFEKWKKESGGDLKDCPKCGALIERIAGCSHMICRACQYQFCFVCKAHTTRTHC